MRKEHLDVIPSSRNLEMACYTVGIHAKSSNTKISVCFGVSLTTLQRLQIRVGWVECNIDCPTVCKSLSDGSDKERTPEFFCCDPSHAHIVLEISSFSLFKPFNCADLVIMCLFFWIPATLWRSLFIYGYLTHVNVITIFYFVLYC